MDTFSTQDKRDDTDLISDYFNNEYGFHMSENKKANLRMLSRYYVVRNGQFSIVTEQREYEILEMNTEKSWSFAIRMTKTSDKQKSIILSLHMGCGDSDTARCLVIILMSREQRLTF
ncbi:Hypothetical predicted protein [Octopus vulgaris]|uniref:Uncharacterized protein n=1 Tax=Octopus vulgaris TaxID=6645 RepID=A0AA36AI31_OCTVU|nr:Hypothetical predicted protein [Octopus vulgaris]